MTRSAKVALTLYASTALVVLAACQQADPAPVARGEVTRTAPQAPPAPVPERPAPQAVSLVGQWRVAGIDDRAFDEPYGLALSADAEKLWWEPSCAGMGRRYQIVGQSISFTPFRPPVPAGSPTPPVCAIGLPPRLDEVFRAIDAASTVARTPENGILLSGGGHSLTLFSQ